MLLSYFHNILPTFISTPTPHQQSYDKILQAEQLLLTEQATCKALDQEIQMKKQQIAELEAEKKRKEEVLTTIEKARDYLIHEETDEFPEVSVCAYYSLYYSPN